MGKSPEEQLELVKGTAKPIVDLIAEGHEVILAHGNGPQVGMINLAMETSSNSEADTPSMPFPECGAMSQGYIGYHLQNAIREELLNRGMNTPVATVVTQVIVDENDSAFNNPTKPIGSFYTLEESLKLEKSMGYDMVEDSGRGYRRVVPSPMPIDVKEKDVIKSLLKDNHIVITVGGGGIPVIRKGHTLEGVAAVIDKDNASAKLAEIIDADILVILTAVDNVYINFGKENEEALHEVSIDRLENLVSENQFSEGSMLPKIKASINFAKNKKIAVIASLDNADEAFKLEAGTIIKG